MADRFILRANDNPHSRLSKPWRMVDTTGEKDDRFYESRKSAWTAAQVANGHVAPRKIYYPKHDGKRAISLGGKVLLIRDD